jgi:hypothetical protein
MVLTAGNLVYYLIERALVTRDEVVDGGLMIIESSFRNRGFKVLRRGQHGYFVKQVRTWDERSKAAWKCEVACYLLSRDDGGFQTLAALMPRCYGHDPARYVLTLELLQDAESLADWQQRSGDFSTHIAAALGRALSAYHSGTAGTMKNGSRPTVFPAEVPWILSFHEMGDEVAGSMSEANWRMLQILRRDPEFPGALAAARSKWQPSTLIHGDIKWDNTLVSNTGNDPIIRLVDWELADFGDPCWDTGAVLQTYLGAWILSMDPAAGSDPDQLVNSACKPLGRMRPAIHAFWKSYAAGMDLSGGEERQLLERSTVYCAVRMIQTAYEQMHYAPSLTTPGVSFLQTTLNILTRPRHAVEQLLGIG